MTALVRRLRRSMLYADSSLARERLGFVAALSDIDPIIRTAAPSFRIEHRLLADCKPATRPGRAIPAAGVSLRAGLIGVALVVPTVAPTLHAKDSLNCLLIGVDQFAASQSGLYSRVAGAAATIRVDIITGLIGRS
jgi:hypothetical protein